MTAPLGLTVTKAGTVYYGNQTYRQVPTHKLPTAPVDDTCYWCAAYSNMKLCDAICGHCKLDHVYIKKEARRVQ